MRKSFSVLIAALALALIAFTGGAMAADTIKVGMLAPLTGFAAADGFSVYESVKIAVDKVNKEGGLLGKKVELVCYDDAADPTGFERSNVLFNYPEFGDHLVIGRFCQLASGVKFIMGPANHRLSSATTHPFNVFGGAWTKNTPPHMDQLPRKGDTVVGNDVWIGQHVTVLPGVHIGDGAIIGANSVVTKDVPAYTIAGGNPCRVIRKRFSEELIAYLEEIRWWNWDADKIFRNMDALCSGDLEKIRRIQA